MKKFSPSVTNQSWLAGSVLMLVTLLLYAPTLFSQFLYYDDDFYIFENSHVLSGLTPTFFKWFLTANVIGNWHPLTFLSHAIDCQIFGLWPGGHHLTSVLFHAANALLVFTLFLRMTGSVGKSFLLAAVFAWHPVKIESVAWVAERKDVLSTFFVLLSLIFYAAYTKSRELTLQNKQKYIHFALCGLFFVLSLLCKPMYVTLPILLFLFDIWPLQRKEFTFNLIFEKIPFAFFSAISCLLTYKIVQATAGAVAETQPNLSFLYKVFEVGQHYADYLKAFFFPFHLSPFYPAMPIRSHFLPAVWTGTLVIFTLFFFSKRKTFAPAWIGWCFFLTSMLPVIGIIQVGSHSIACRYLYGPSLGLSFAVIWSVCKIAERNKWQKVLPWLSAITLTILLCVSSRDLPYWQNTYKLFYRALQVSPQNNITAHINLRSAYSREGKRAEAAVHLIEAIELSPKVIERFSVSWSDFYWMSEVFLKRGEREKAITSLSRAYEMLSSPVVVSDDKAPTLEKIQACIEKIKVDPISSCELAPA